MPHVFISYVRENKEAVDRLYQDLTAHGISVWLDRNDIDPGLFWKEAIRKAISQGDFFIACFSAEYNTRPRSYMNEELTLAIEELRQRPTDKAWFISVLFSGEIPDRDIGAGKTLRDIQCVELKGTHWDEGIQSILRVIPVKPPTNINENEIEILTSLDLDRSIPIDIIVATLKLDYQKTQFFLDQLEEKGLVSAQWDLGEGTQYRLTGKGRAFLKISR